ICNPSYPPAGRIRGTRIAFPNPSMVRNPAGSLADGIQFRPTAARTSILDLPSSPPLEHGKLQTVA
ncbi:MAG: hypothetical protein WD066_09290, partial [Planctomycetaceae bacterium]